MLTGNSLTKALERISTRPSEETGNCFRLVPLVYQNELLSGRGSLERGGRVNKAHSFEVLYTSGSPITALKETRFLIDGGNETIPILMKPYIILSLRHRLQSILDLTQEEVQRQLATNLQELTGDWSTLHAQGRAVPTQELGNAAYQSRIQAIKIPSSVDLGSNGFNLAIFPDRLAPSGFIEVFDPKQQFRERLPKL